MIKFIDMSDVVIKFVAGGEGGSDNTDNTSFFLDLDKEKEYGKVVVNGGLLVLDNVSDSLVSGGGKIVLFTGGLLVVDNVSDLSFLSRFK